MSSSRRCQVQIQQRNRADVLGWGFHKFYWSDVILLITVSHDFDNSSSLDSFEKFNTALISSQSWISSCKFVFSIVEG